MSSNYHEPVRGRGRLSILANESGSVFADRVHTQLCQIMKEARGKDDTYLRATEEIRFPNGEIKTVIQENVRGDDVYVVQCMDDPLSDRSINDNLMALVTTIHAADVSDAASITVVIPQFPYSRQERKKTREAITARVVARLLEDAGADRVITLDIHAEAIMGFFNRCTLEDLHASALILDHFVENFDQDNLVVAAPDVGGADMARYYSNRLNVPLAIVDKLRDYTKASSIESMRLVGDVNNHNVLMPDDMIATGGTLMKACGHLKEQGAQNLYLACSLPFFNGGAVELFEKSHEEGVFDHLIATDGVIRGQEFVDAHPWYHEVSVAPLFARVIFNINQKLSVSSLLR